MNVTNSNSGESLDSVQQMLAFLPRRNAVGEGVVSNRVRKFESLVASYETHMARLRLEQFHPFVERANARVALFGVFLLCTQGWGSSVGEAYVRNYLLDVPATTIASYIGGT